MTNKIFIVIAVHNRIEFTKKCLASLSKQNYNNFEVIIIDDGSTDGTYEFINAKYPNWKIIKGTGSWWWTRSMFEGVNYALKKSNKGDFVLSFNNDCFVKSNYLNNILSASIKSKRSIIGSVVVDADDHKKLIESGIKINWKEYSILGITNKVHKLKFFSNRNGLITDTDTLPGKGTLIPIEVFKKIGNFNYKRLPHYISDYEFFIRAVNNGFKLRVSTNSVLYNFSKATGTEHLTGFTSSYKKVFHVIFDRKSKLNIIDNFQFILLTCPPEYLGLNIKRFMKRLVYYLFNLWPFCYAGPLLLKIRVFFHNIPIMIVQLNKENIGKYQCKICGGNTYLKHKGLYDDRHGYPEKFDVYKCFDCAFMQTEPQIPLKKLSYIYTKYYPKRDANIDSIVAGANNLPTINLINKNGWNTTCHFQTKRNQNVLDIGCGTCQSLLEIERLKGKAWGLDPDKNSRRVANKLKLRFHYGTIHNCPFPTYHFDLITASQVLEHEPDPIKFLFECKKFLKPGKKVILSFPNTGSISNFVWKRKWLHWHIPYHLNHFSRKSVAILANKSSYKINSIKTITPNLWPILQIKSFVNNIKIGERDSMWDSKPTGQRVSKKGSANYKKLIIEAALVFLNKIAFINRIIDAAGLGDSFVVELSQ